MSEDEVIDEIWKVWSAGGVEEALALTEKAIDAFQSSAELLCLFGDLIQLSKKPAGRYTSADALSAYEKAAALDPGWAEAFEEIGHYCDVYKNDFLRAEAAFRRAIELGAGADSYAGLARVLAERGNTTAEILSFLDASPFAADSKIQEMRAEIAEGLWAPERKS